MRVQINNYLIVRSYSGWAVYRGGMRVYVASSYKQAFAFAGAN